MPHPPHILLIDDHAEVRAILARLLRQHYPASTIAEAADGAEALAAVAQQSPDLIITDYQMPIMGGLELVRRLRAQGATMPIVALSSDSSIAEAMLAAGADQFVHKPVGSAALRQLLRRLLPDAADTRSVGE